MEAQQGKGRTEPVEELGPLPGGHHNLTPEQIADSRRERLLAAMASGVAVRGYQGVTITELSKLASVSTRDFYLVFPSKEDCFLAAFEAIRNHLAEMITDAAAVEDGWPQEVIAALRASLTFFAAEPDLARLFLLEAVSATPGVAKRFRETVLAAAPALARGRAELADSEALLPGSEGIILGGMVSVVSRTVLAGEIEKLPKLLPDFTEFALAPYLGAERAARLAAGSSSIL